MKSPLGQKIAGETVERLSHRFSYETLLRQYSLETWRRFESAILIEESINRRELLLDGWRNVLRRETINTDRRYEKEEKVFHVAPDH